MRNSLLCGVLSLAMLAFIPLTRIWSYDKACAAHGVPPTPTPAGCGGCYVVGTRWEHVPYEYYVLVDQCVTVPYLVYSPCCPYGMIQCYTEVQQVLEPRIGWTSYQHNVYGSCDNGAMFNNMCNTSPTYTTTKCTVAQGVGCGAGTYYDDSSCSQQLPTALIPPGIASACPGIWDEGSTQTVSGQECEGVASGWF